MNYENMSPEAQAIFITADLFGNSGKRYNSEFAAIILRRAAELFQNAYANEEYIDSADNFLFGIANELDPQRSEEN